MRDMGADVAGIAITLVILTIYDPQLLSNFAQRYAEVRDDRA